jgi:hypothetical protein
MSCERYWCEGILLVERGERDPHRDTCVACRREHKARGELIQALPLVAATSTGDPQWEARVWSRIARLEPSRTRHRWRVAGLATAFTAILLCWAIGQRDPSDEVCRHIEVAPYENSLRSSLPDDENRVRSAIKRRDEMRIYRADRLVVRCLAGSTDGDCDSDARDMLVEVLFAVPGEYRVVIITFATAEPIGGLVRDLEAVVAAGGEYQMTELSVH